ncbi:sulfatase [Luteolibacter pohnpeiensis]|uniref:Sulfatase n=1 Tax=Luteolibacter pohnpeiensis TaxID=454153 RepID=A0A934S665_9BACT|nr:sulfatase [Luteolibacter pohnpeiensis]MBK1883825.1 sulfatase [Luteolibacter pohnpeiensis]
MRPLNFGILRKSAVNLCILALVGNSFLHAEATKLPNMVIFISDDHTLTDSSVYGSKDLATPNMARVAAAGMTFEDAFAASPSCAPSRAAILTGLMPAKNGAEPNHAAPRPEIKKLPAYLQELGYEVVAFGKVGHYVQTKDYGFDLSEHNKFHEDIAIPAALDWLRDRKSDKPLCLFVGTNWPHVPWPQKHEDYNPAEITIPANHVDTPVTRNARASYYAAVKRMDDELGEVYDLAQEKFGEDLFFMQFSDQGAQWPFGKWCLYDNGLRTPLLAVWPGHVKPASHSDAMVSLIDVLPTLVDVAGGTPPKDIDGESFADVLEGKTTTHRDKIYATHSGDGDFNVYPSRCVRDARWKYILNLHPEFEFNSHVTLKDKLGIPYWNSWVKKAKTNADAAMKVKRYQQRPKEELYDLATDPLEQHNLADNPDCADRLEAMRADLKSWMEQQGDKQTVYGHPKLLSQD